MGNQVSSQNDENKIDKNNGIKPEVKNGDDKNLDLFYFKDAYSSYRGIKTDTITTEGNQNIEKSVPSNDESTNDKSEVPDNKVPILFEWKEGGNDVYLTGSFTNWTQRFIMAKNQLGNFE